MNQYEKLLNIIQGESKKHNSESLKVGKMRSATTCEVGGLVLEKEDLYIADHLINPPCIEVNISIDNGIITDKSKYMKPLKAGDLVVLYRLSDEKYLLLERVV